MASHATLTEPYGGGMADWREVLAKVRAHPDVVGAAPFVEVQAMLVNGSKVSGALVRGIVPVEEDQVAELRRDMVRGSVDDLAAGRVQHHPGPGTGGVLGVGVGRQGDGGHPPGERHPGRHHAAAQALHRQRHLRRRHGGL